MTRLRPPAIGVVILALTVVAGCTTCACELTPPSPSPTATVPTGGLFLAGQALAGDGWRIVAAGTHLRRDTLGAMASPFQVTLLSGTALGHLSTLLVLPVGTPAIDPSTEAALVIGLLVDEGPICGQVRFDGVTVDTATRTLTARYSPAQLLVATPPATPPWCPLVGIPAAIVVEVDMARLASGTWTVELARFGGVSWATVVTASATI